MSLKSYHQKRNFNKTPEPRGRVHHGAHHFFCVQKHAASHLHYDFRLELQGVLKSWAVPKGPCLDPTVKRLAVHVEDHPLEYGTFEGTIPKGEYGGGTVLLWDQGEWENLDHDPVEAYDRGHLRFYLEGKKLKGRWDLIRFKENKDWFLVKYKDKFARSIKHYDITEEEPLSVLTYQDMDAIAEHAKATWTRSSTKKKLSIQAPKASFPDRVFVQLATLVDKPPQGDEWIHEVKFDGYRLIAFKNNKTVHLISRNQKDWTNSFLSIADAIKELPVKQAVFDGELVLLDEHQRSNFQLLQNSVKGGREAPFIYYLFDLLFLEKYDLRTLPLLERKAHLASILLQAPPSIRYSDHVVDHGDEMFKHACKFELEGIVSKRRDSPYMGKRTKSWLKVKCAHRQEFVVGGFSKGKGARSYFGSLYLGVFNSNRELVFTGNVGTGFTEASLKNLYNRLKKLIIQDNPFSTFPPQGRSATWVKPQLIVEVEFSQWTQDGRLRHPSFKGLRLDKKVQEVGVEKTEAVEIIEKPKIVLTHPDKILYPEDGFTKKDIYAYYEEVSSSLLPFIKNRPLTLVRCPSDYKGCFYQKHISQARHAHLLKVPVQGKRGVIRQYIYLNDEAGILSLAQMGVLEIHPWGSQVNDLAHPDVLIFDLDPAPEMSWKEVVKAAFEIKAELARYQLTTFVKTTGGKGLHVVLPIEPHYDWDTIKNFTRVFVEYLEMSFPKKYVSNMSKEKRRGKIFVDYLRNQHDATAIAAYSPRARLHAPVAVPLDWDELTHDRRSTFYTIKTLPKRLQHLKADPWEAFWMIKQKLPM